MEFYYILCMTILTFGACDCSAVSSNNSNRTFIYATYEYNEIINVLVNSTTEQILNFVEKSEDLRRYPTRVHVSSNDTINGEYPLFITATQQKGVSSWELPLVIQTSHSTMQFKDMARTLCPHDAGPNITTENRPMIQLTTSNPKNVSVSIKLRRVQDFYVKVDNEIQLNVTPSTPKYYYFSFEGNNITRFNYTIPKSVLLSIESDDNVCAAISIQNNSCPVFDNEKDMLYQGYHFTMTTKGGITLTQSMFPKGFYIVFIVKETDEECSGVSETAIGEHSGWMLEGKDGAGRVKNFRFRIVPTISYWDYVVGYSVIVALSILIALFSFVVYIPTCSCTETVVLVEEQPGSSRVDEEVPIINEDIDETKTTELNSDSEPDLDDSLPRILTVARLNRIGPEHRDRRTNRYFWNMLTVALVYALPVVQLLATYQRMVFQTGDQDVCYYNFLCAHPLGFLSDSNHVLSNTPYIILGAVFMMQNWARQRRNRQKQNYGIPQHSGLFYCLGVALVMEGLLSACYHLCPNKMNFQFDSSFMYVISVLCMVKLYQNRHPDINASAHSTFMLIAFIMALGLYGIMYPSVYFWVFFTILHLGTCFVLTLKIYYVGRFKLDRHVASRAVSALREFGVAALAPNYIARAVLLAVANLANWCLASYGLYEHNKDFARHLLAILMGNTIIYTMFYIIMKLIHKERILVPTWIYFILAHVAWFIGLRLFLDSKTKWSETPAQSRSLNAPCSVLYTLDTHDTWHAVSAAALFLSFNLLLSVDDDLQATPAIQIPVF